MGQVEEFAESAKQTVNVIAVDCHYVWERIGRGNITRARKIEARFFMCDPERTGDLPMLVFIQPRYFSDTRKIRFLDHKIENEGALVKA